MTIIVGIGIYKLLGREEIESFCYDSDSCFSLFFFFFFCLFFFIREKDFIQERESLLQQQNERDQQYNALVKSLKDRVGVIIFFLVYNAHP